MDAIFAVFVFLTLFGTYGDYLYVLADESIFLTSGAFLFSHLNHTGGLLVYFSRFCMMFLRNPLYGAAVVSACLVAVQLLTAYTFRLRRNIYALSFIPAVILFYAFINHIYFALTPQGNDFIFGWILGTILAFLFVAVFRYLVRFRPITSLLFGVIGGTAFYYVAGLFGLLGLVLCIISADTLPRHRRWFQLALLLCALAVPLFCYIQLLTHEPLFWVYCVGIPLTPLGVVWYVPYIAFILFVIFLAIFCRWRDGIKQNLNRSVFWHIAANFLGTALLCFVSVNWSHLSSDTVSGKQNTLMLFRCFALADQENWQGIIQALQASGKLSPETLAFNDAAMFKTQQLSEYFFRINRSATPSFDGASRVFYHLGLYNAAVQAAMNDSAYVGGTSVGELKIQASCALITEEYELARKYFLVLKSTPIYSRWAKARLRYIRCKDALPAEDIALQNIHADLMAHRKIMPQNDRCGNTISMQYVFFVSHENDDLKKAAPEVQDVVLLSCMLREDMEDFKKGFELWCELHPERQVPAAFQEAYIVCRGDKKHIHRISSSTIERVKQYVVNPQSPEFYGTYWSYLRRLQQARLENSK